MSDNFIVNDGDGAKLVPVEAKEPTIVKEAKEAMEKLTAVPAELITPVTSKKRKYTKKVKVDAPVEEVKEKPQTWYCSTCREDIDDKNAMKIGAGPNRWAVFCPQCQRSFGFQDQAMHDKVADFVKNNPTGK